MAPNGLPRRAFDIVQIRRFTDKMGRSRELEIPIQAKNRKQTGQYGKQYKEPIIIMANVGDQVLKLVNKIPPQGIARSQRISASRQAFSEPAAALIRRLDRLIADSRTKEK